MLSSIAPTSFFAIGEFSLDLIFFWARLEISKASSNSASSAALLCFAASEITVAGSEETTG